MTISIKSLADAMKGIYLIVGIFFAIFIAIVIYLLVGGSISNVALSGDVEIPSSVNTTIDSTITTMNANATSLFNKTTLVISLVAIVVVVVAFGVGKLLSGGKGKGGTGY